MYTQMVPDILKGVILFSSYLTRSQRPAEFPIPFLTLSGDLDGVARITRSASSFRYVGRRAYSSRRIQWLALQWYQPFPLLFGKEKGFCKIASHRSISGSFWGEAGVWWKLLFTLITSRNAMLSLYPVILVNIKHFTVYKSDLDWVQWTVFVKNCLRALVPAG